ncbi:MAG: hypothetical protein J0H74_35395 [Chitinophagaceae bacterium]|nr:hypothetical protein [Chitinophagaceae bacterium]
MKQTLYLCLAMLLLCAGCASSSINVIDKKNPTRPYTKVLVAYLDEGCDFTLFDSLTYDICLKSCFLNADSYPTRVQAENMLADQLTTGTAIVKATDVLDITYNSYDYFRRVIDSLHIDAILMVDLRRYTHTDHPAYSAPLIVNGHMVTPGTGYNVKTLNGAYECFLINTGNIHFPIWHAAIDVKGRTSGGEHMINNKMAKELARSLTSAGYWMH